MESQTTTAKVGTHKDVYAIINDRIIELLQKGIVPWRKPWTDAGIPRNVISRKPYRWINLLLLSSLGYERNFFITEKQLAGIGGSIKPKEKPHLVAYWNYKDKDGKKQSPVLRYYPVYNMGQCMWPPDAIQPGLTKETHTLATCQEIVDNMPHCPAIKTKEPAPYYDVIEDFINMPKLKAFNSQEEYFSALFHQMVHATGHHTRLDRMGLVQMAEYGYSGCSLENLVAEIGSCYLQSLTGITTAVEPEPGYIADCIGRFKKDKIFIFTAAALAQKALDFILNTEFEVEEVEETEAVTVL